PFVAAVALVARDSGAAGVRALFARMVDVRELSAGWAVAGLLVMPGVLALASVLQRLGGRDLPGSGVPLPLVPALLVVFLVGALAEQTGWTGYLQEPVRRRLGTLPAAAAVGGVWGLWHVVPYLQANSVRWTVWQVLFTVLLRVVVVWAYDGAGRRAPVAVLVHAVPTSGTPRSPATTRPSPPRWPPPSSSASSPCRAARTGGPRGTRTHNPRIKSPLLY